MILGGGTYDQLRIVSTAIVDHKEGEPKIVIRLEDPHAQDMGITDYLYTSNAAWDKMTVKRLKAYGFDAKTTPLFDLNDDPSPLAGMLVGPVVVEEEDFQGKTQYKVARVGEFINERMDPESARALQATLAARLGTPVQKMGGARKAAPKAAPVRVAVPAGGIEDDDSVPF